MLLPGENPSKEIKHFVVKKKRPKRVKQFFGNKFKGDQHFCDEERTASEEIKKFVVKNPSKKIENFTVKKKTFKGDQYFCVDEKSAHKDLKDVVKKSPERTFRILL